MMTATELAQELRLTLVGERVNSQGSRKAKELLLADDYDGLVQGRRSVTGGAHVLDSRGADRAPGRGGPDGRAGQAHLAVAAGPDPDRLHRARGDPGRARADPRRAIVNSVNLEAGRGKLDVVVPVARARRPR